jgi:hypothetical protein
MEDICRSLASFYSRLDYDDEVKKLCDVIEIVIVIVIVGMVNECNYLYPFLRLND